MSFSPLAYADSLRIGSIDFVSPDEIKVLLDIEAPDSVALNTGTPRPFPRINGYILISSDNGYLVGQVEWITIERSQYPKRKGMQDFGLVDLPYPLRKMSLNPLGTLQYDSKDSDGDDRYTFKRGVESFPSVGDAVLLPTQKQLRSIVESGENRRVKIGTSPLAANAEVKIDPDRLFGRHLAVLGNTGSGKSCSVAGLIRWSLEAAKKECGEGKEPNARFIVLDPNGEYTHAFNGATNARVFSVDPTDEIKQLQVPLWFWNSAEWSAFTQASGRAQRPVLQQALRQRRNAEIPGTANPHENDLIFYLQGSLSSIRQELANHSPFASGKEGKYWGFLELLKCIYASLQSLAIKDLGLKVKIEPITNHVHDLLEVKCKNERGFNKPFEYDDIDSLINNISSCIEKMGGLVLDEKPLSEDTPIAFEETDLITDLDFLATNSGNRQWFDSFLARIRTMLSDTRMKTITGNVQSVTLDGWLNNYIGNNMASNGTVTVIDLSLVPAEVMHIITAVISRMTFESLQRYRKLHPQKKSLPTVLVMEEAHTFIKRYKDDTDNNDAAAICCQVFEKIAREGRKFGLGLVLSSQRPSELSPTVLSQCNSFLLHRISNDSDQELVHKLVPDNLRGLLRDLPSLPSRAAILLGWASELPLLVQMNELPENQRPKSDDPDFWDVWSNKSPRDVQWKTITDDWQQVANQPEPNESEEQKNE